MSHRSSMLPVDQKELDKLFEFLVEATKNVAMPISVWNLSRQYIKKTRSSLKVSNLNDRINRNALYIHEMDNLDKDTKVKLIFALSAPIDYDFLIELYKEATVVIDESRRIIEFKKKGGGLNLIGNHNHRESLFTDKDEEMLDFLAEKAKNTSLPILDIDFLTEYKAVRGVPEQIDWLKKRYQFNKKEIYETIKFDKEMRIRMMFISNTNLHNYVIRDLQSDAVVVLDEQKQIVTYKANDGSLELSRTQTSTRKRAATPAKRHSSVTSNPIPKKRHSSHRPLHSSVRAVNVTQAASSGRRHHSVISRTDPFAKLLQSTLKRKEYEKKKLRMMTGFCQVGSSPRDVPRRDFDSVKPRVSTVKPVPYDYLNQSGPLILDFNDFSEPRRSSDEPDVSNHEGNQIEPEEAMELGDLDYPEFVPEQKEPDKFDYRVEPLNVDDFSLEIPKLTNHEEVREDTDYTGIFSDHNEFNFEFQEDVVRPIENDPTDYQFQDDQYFLIDSPRREGIIVDEDLFPNHEEDNLNLNFGNGPEDVDYNYMMDSHDNSHSSNNNELPQQSSVHNPDTENDVSRIQFDENIATTTDAFLHFNEEIEIDNEKHSQDEQELQSIFDNCGEELGVLSDERLGLDYNDTEETASGMNNYELEKEDAQEDQTHFEDVQMMDASESLCFETENASKDVLQVSTEVTIFGEPENLEPPLNETNEETTSDVSALSLQFNDEVIKSANNAEDTLSTCNLDRYTIPIDPVARPFQKQEQIVVRMRASNPELPVPSRPEPAGSEKKDQIVSRVHLRNDDRFVSTAIEPEFENELKMKSLPVGSLVDSNVPISSIKDTKMNRVAVNKHEDSDTSDYSESDLKLRTEQKQVQHKDINIERMDTSSPPTSSSKMFPELIPSKNPTIENETSDVKDAIKPAKTSGFPFSFRQRRQSKILELKQSEESQLQNDKDPGRKLEDSGNETPLKETTSSLSTISSKQNIEKEQPISSISSHIEQPIEKKSIEKKKEDAHLVPVQNYEDSGSVETPSSSLKTSIFPYPTTASEESTQKNIINQIEDPISPNFSSIERQLIEKKRPQTPQLEKSNFPVSSHIEEQPKEDQKPNMPHVQCVKDNQSSHETPKPTSSLQQSFIENQIIPVEVHTSFLESILTVMVTLDLSKLNKSQERVEKKIEKIEMFGNKKESITFSELRAAIFSCLLVISKSAIVKLEDGEETINLKEFLLIFRTSLAGMKLPVLSICDQKLQSMIEELPSHEKKLSARKVVAAFQYILEIVAP